MQSLSHLSSYHFNMDEFHVRKKFWRHDSSQFPKMQLAKKFNMQLLCQTVGRNCFSLPRALWQVHCGRIDCYIGGKWIVITCQCSYDTWLGAIWFVTGLLIWPDALAPARSRLPRLAGGRYKPSLHRSRAQPLRGYTSVKQGVRFVKLSSKIASVIDVCFFSLCAYSNITRRQADGREKKENGCSVWNGREFIVKTTARGINTINVASISLIKNRNRWRLWAKKNDSMDYTGIRALAINSCRLRGNRGPYRQNLTHHPSNNLHPAVPARHCNSYYSMSSKLCIVCVTV